MVAVDATLQVEQPDTSLDPLKVAADAQSPTGVALPVLDAAVRALLDLILNQLLAPQVVIATDLDIRPLLLATDSVRQTQRPMLDYVATQSAADGVVTVHATGPAERIRLLRLDGGSKPNNPADTFCTVTIKVGAATRFLKTLQVGEPIGGQVCLEGPLGDDLTVEVTGTGSVEFNIRYELFT